MKYAFIFGSNVFIVPTGVISYIDHDQTTEFLKIRSIYNSMTQSHLSVDIDLKDIEGRGLKLIDNQLIDAIGFTILEERDRVLVTRPDNSTVIDVHQLDDRSAMQLEHNITAELEVHAPIAVIRLRGDFMLSRLHIEVDNEKLFISSNSYAGSAIAGHNGLQFTAAGVVL
jgi:hypothetical protein